MLKVLLCPFSLTGMESYKTEKFSFLLQNWKMSDGEGLNYLPKGLFGENLVLPTMGFSA